MNYDDLTRFSAFSGLFYFIAIFAVVLVYALRPKNRQKFEDAASIPLRED
jgi:cytochrome c oxidase cbb3-type subunit 4